MTYISEAACRSTHTSKSKRGREEVKRLTTTGSLGSINSTEATLIGVWISPPTVG